MVSPMMGARVVIGILTLIIAGGEVLTACVPPDGSPAQPTRQRAVLSAGTGSCPLDQRLVPRCGALWGVYAASGPGQGWASPFTTLERHMRRRFDIVKRYHDWSGTRPNGRFPDRAERHLGSGKHPRILY